MRKRLSRPPFLKEEFFCGGSSEPNGVLDRLLLVLVKMEVKRQSLVQFRPKRHIIGGPLDKQASSDIPSVILKKKAIKYTKKVTNTSYATLPQKSNEIRKDMPMQNFPFSRYS
jgi:hypothetical protein